MGADAGADEGGGGDGGVDAGGAAGLECLTFADGASGDDCGAP